MWFVENLPWMLIALALGGLIAFIVYRLVKAKKCGKTSCGCGCEACAMRDACHASKPKNTP